MKFKEKIFLAVKRELVRNCDSKKFIGKQIVFLFELVVKNQEFEIFIKTLL